LTIKSQRLQKAIFIGESDAGRVDQKQTNPEAQTQDTEAIWNLAREGGTDNVSIGNRGSFTDEENAGIDNIVKGIEEGSNKQRATGTEGSKKIPISEDSDIINAAAGLATGRKREEVSTANKEDKALRHQESCEIFSRILCRSCFFSSILSQEFAVLLLRISGTFRIV
jgi:hypothetical protein